MKQLFFVFFLAVIVFSSCKKDIPPDSTPAPTTDELARDYLYEIMKSIYLWYKEMPVVVKEDYKDPYELMKAMKYKALDRWSFVQTYDEFIAFESGSFVGHGISYGLDQENKVRIAQIYNDAPLYANGVRRGWIIKKLNGTDLAPLFINNDAASIRQLFGPAEAGVTNTFLFELPADGRDSIITSTKSSFTLNTVIYFDTLNLKSGITGHLVFNLFIPPSINELETAFAFFSQNNITDLILDIRYNRGGDLNVVPNMAGYIAGSTKFEMPFLKLSFNDKNSDYNQTFNFQTVSYPLNLTKLVTICSRETASASEDLINGLKPYLNVISIGDTTDGKPVGMVGINYKTDYMFWPITYSLVNSEDQGEFYDGIAPEKYVPDDITRDWSDRNELCLKEAIYYLENGSVSPKGIYNYQPSIRFSEKPERMNNAYILGK